MTTPPSGRQRPSTLEELYATPWVASWLDRAADGDRSATNHRTRAAAWAHWAASRLEIRDGRHGLYPAIGLEGHFYDFRTGTRPAGRGNPHLPISGWRLGRPDPQFPDRLALAGQTLGFCWWVRDEADAVRQALLFTPSAPIDLPARWLAATLPALRDAVRQLAERAVARWEAVEQLLAAGDEDFADLLTRPFDVEEVASFAPGAADMSLHLAYNAQLADRNGRWAPRRTGVWSLRGRPGPSGPEFALGVLTPRLTRNSQFGDPQFAVAVESPAALLVRGLVLRRLLAGPLDQPADDVALSHISTGEQSGHFRASPAQPGQRLPRASTAAAVALVQAYPDAARAWQALSTWAADRARVRLTVDRATFLAAHDRAVRSVARAEVHRDDIDALLPVGWQTSPDVDRADTSSANGRAVRVIYARR